MRRIVLHCAVSLLLVFTQQVAIAHVTAHAAQHVSHHDPLHDGDKNCEKCLAMSHLGDAVGGNSRLVLARLCAPRPPVAAVILVRENAFQAYRSRAPPTVL
jgi:hypothetical protein